MRKISAVILVALVLFIISNANAQIVKVVKPMFSGVQIATSAGDSVTGFSLAAVTNGISALSPSQVPDSIRVKWWASADSVYSVKIRWKASIAGSGLYTSVYIDTIHSTTAAKSQESASITGSDYLSYDLYGLSLIARSAQNATVEANASKLYVWLEFYYHIVTR